MVRYGHANNGTLCRSAGPLGGRACPALRFEARQWALGPRGGTVRRAGAGFRAAGTRCGIGQPAQWLRLQLAADVNDLSSKKLST